MGERANLFDDGMERVHSAWDSVEDELGKIQKNIEGRRKQLEESAEKGFDQLRQTTLGKRIDALREDAQKQWNTNVESLIGLFPIPTQHEVKRLERRITQLTRKLNSLEKAQAAALKETASAKATDSVKETAATQEAAAEPQPTRKAVPVAAVEVEESKQARA